MKINVNHYWAKTVDGEYGGDIQQLMMEVLIAAICLAITFYSAKTRGLELFFAGFIIPTAVFTLAAASTIYRIASRHLEKRKSKATEQEDKTTYNRRQ